MPRSMVDEAGTVLDVNTFGATQLGYARAELIGQSVLEVFLEEDRACVRTCLKDVGQTRTWDVQKVRKDGSVLWVRESAKAMLWADKQPIVLIACEDITERRRTELALQRSEAHLAQAQELSHTGSFSWNPTTGEAFWSQETFRIFQLDRQTVPLGPQLVVERTHPDDRASVQEIIDRAMRDPSDFEHEYRLLLPDGSVKHIHGNGAVMSPVTRKSTEGLPLLYLRDIPPVADGGPKIHEPRIYYSEQSDNYVIVKGSTPEFDYPKGKDNVYAAYDGTGGIPIGAAVWRGLFAYYFNDPNLLLSSYITTDSRIMPARHGAIRVSGYRAPIGSLYWPERCEGVARRRPGMKEHR